MAPGSTTHVRTVVSVAHSIRIQRRSFCQVRSAVISRLSQIQPPDRKEALPTGHIHSSGHLVPRELPSLERQPFTVGWVVPVSTGRVPPGALRYLPGGRRVRGRRPGRAVRVLGRCRPRSPAPLGEDHVIDGPLSRVWGHVRAHRDSTPRGVDPWSPFSAKLLGPGRSRPGPVIERIADRVTGMP